MPSVFVLCYHNKVLAIVPTYVDPEVDHGLDILFLELCQHVHTILAPLTVGLH